MNDDSLRETHTIKLQDMKSLSVRYYRELTGHGM